MGQREIWDKLAIQWATFRHKPQEAVTEFLKDRKGLILDVGCGAGRNLVKGKKFVAMDFSKEMIDMARRKLIYRDDADFAVADGKEMPFRDRKFDAALLVAVLHNMYRNEHEKMLRELNRVMKPGAELLVTVWNKRQPRFFLKGKESFIEWKLGERRMQRYYYLFTKKELKQLLEKNGFQVISIRGSMKKSFGFSSDVIAVARKRY